MVSRSLILPVLTLCCVQGVGNSLSTHIFPFIAAYLLSIGVKPSEVSTYSGLAESLISLVQLITLPIHIWAVKRFSHKACLVVSLLATGCLAATFGLCTQSWQILLLRALTGAINLGSFVGNIVLGEIVDEQSKAQAFSWFSAGNFFGAMGGAAISGYLAEPQGRVPIFGNIHFFQVKPYTLPGMTLLWAALISALGVIVYLPETNKALGVSLNDPWQESIPDGQQMTYRALVKNPAFRHIAAVNAVVKVCFFGSLSLMSTAGKLPAAIGGLGLSVAQIGLVLFITQLLTATNLVLIFGKVAKHMPLRRIAFISSIGWLMIAVFFPVANTSYHKLGHIPVPLYGLWLVGNVLGMMRWPCSHLLPLALYPEVGDRAKATGVIRQTSNLASAFGAATYGHIFGISSSYQTGSTGRSAIWVWASAFACLAILVASRNPEAIPRPRNEDQAEEETALLSNPAI